MRINRYEFPDDKVVEEMLKDTRLFKLPTILKRKNPTPVEKEYGKYFGEPPLPDVDWGRDNEDPMDFGVGDGADRRAVARGIAFILRNNVREDRIGKHPVEDSFEKAMANLGLSADLKTFVNERLDYYNTSACWSQSAEDSRLYALYFHLSRVGIHSFSIGNFLKLPQEFRKDLFVAAALHDIGKGMINHPRNQYKSYEEYEEEMIKHPFYSVQDIGSFSESHVNDRTLSVIERHHCSQANPYPSSFTTPESPEARFLAKVLSVADFHDSAATRANNKFRRNLFERLTRRELPSSKKIRELMLADKGKISMEYEGNEFSSPYRTIGDFIEDVYGRVIGVGNPLNPSVYY